MQVEDQVEVSRQKKPNVVDLSGIFTSSYENVSPVWTVAQGHRFLLHWTSNSFFGSLSLCLSSFPVIRKTKKSGLLRFDGLEGGPSTLAHNTNWLAC